MAYYLLLTFFCSKINQQIENFSLTKLVQNAIKTNFIKGLCIVATFNTTSDSVAIFHVQGLLLYALSSNFRTALKWQLIVQYFEQNLVVRKNGH